MFGGVPKSTVSVKTQEIQFVFTLSLVCGLEAVHTEEVSASMRRWRRLFPVKPPFVLPRVTGLPGETQGGRQLPYSLTRMHISHLLRQC